MAAVEQELRDALTRFMRAATEKDREVVATALARVTELQQRLGPDASPMLRHYLERRSYQKALDHLNSGRPETEAPSRGHSAGAHGETGLS
jgi:hypothetical protein